MKIKTSASVAILAAIIIMIISACSSSTAVDSYPTFAKLMDKLVGPGQWSAQSHTDGPENRLIVNGLAFKLKPKDKNVSAPVAESVVEIETVEIKNLLDPETMETVLAAVDWRHQKAVNLADSVILKGISFQTAVASDVLSFVVEIADASGIRLAAADTNGPAGRAGFLKALNADQFSYRKVTTSIRSEDFEATYTAGLTEMRDVTFAGETIPGFEILESSGLYSVMSGMTAGSVSVKDVSVGVKSLDPDMASCRMVVASIDGKDTRNSSVKEMTVNGLRVDLVDKKEDTIVMALDRLRMQGLDISVYIKKIMPMVAAVYSDPDKAEAVMGSTYNLGDFLVSPFSLDEMSLNGAELTFGNLVSIKVAEVGIVGPYRAGEIPHSQKSTMTGMEIILPQDAQAAQKAGLKKLYDFGQQFGMSRFVIDVNGESVYDPKTGRMTSRTTQFAVKDLMNLTSLAEIDGLTPERLERLNSIPLSSVMMAMMAPDAVFGDLAIRTMTFNLEDKGLMNRSLAYAARMMASTENATTIDSESIRALAIHSVQVLTGQHGSRFLANPDALSAALMNFIQNPVSLEVKMVADPPFGVQSVMMVEADVNKVLNSLNLSVSANGQKAPPLKFTLPGK